MRQTLFRIPIDTGLPLGSFELPLFGLGLLLLAWCLFGGWQLRQFLKSKDSKTPIPWTAAAFWLGIAFAIVYAPSWSQKTIRQQIKIASQQLSREPRGLTAAKNYLLRGQFNQQIRNYEQAIADYRLSIEQAGYPVEPQMALARLLAAAPRAEYRNPEEAVTLIDAALELQTVPDVKLLDTAGIVYAAAGNYQRAVEFAKKSAALEFAKEETDNQRLKQIRHRLQLYLNEHPYRDPWVAETFPQSVPVFGYGFLVFLGFVSAATLASWLADKVGVPPQAIWDIGVWGLIAGIAGARIFYMVQYPNRVFGGKSGFALLTAPFQLSDGGLVLLGGVLASSVATIWMAKLKGVKPLLLFDIAIPAFFLALAFGRLGCLMNGCCYGDRCALPWAMQFPLGSVPDMALVGRGFLGPTETWHWGLHPSQIYSSINALILCLFTLVYFRYRTRDGAVLAVGWLLYPISRFLIELLRGDEMGKFGTGLTISQLVSLCLFVGGVLFVIWLRTRPQTLTSWRSASSS